jgi:inhibitor of the pro-sigma K processing machinery
MGLNISIEVILFFSLGLVLLYLLGWLLVAPLKFILKLIANGLLGGLALFLINLLGGIFGITIAINPWTALTVGLLGLPGLALLFILKLIL